MADQGDQMQPGRGAGPGDVQSNPPAAPPGAPETSAGATPTRGHMFLFYASFLTLIAGGIGFAVRGSLLGAWGQQYGFTQFELGQITGAGLWGFPIAIIPLSFVVDKWGYGRVMAIAFSLHVLSAIVTLAATPAYFAAGGNKEAAYWCLYVGSFIFSLANGACESVINPLTATLFPRAKTHWLNILHAGWPGGLILGALIALGLNYLGSAVGHIPWEYSMGTFLIPTLIYGGMMVGRTFPHSEARRAGVSLGVMLLEFASPILLFLFLLHAMVGYVELGTDSWITNITGTILASKNYGLFLFIWTSGLMFILRFFAGPIVHKISPLGLLFCAAVLGFVGLMMLGQAFDSFGTGLDAFWFLLIAATIYALGKTFFWPTMLGVVSERSPKGGALTLGFVGGIGMLSVGLLGNPIIGYEQDYFAAESLSTNASDAYNNRYKADKKDSYLFLPEVSGLDNTKVGTLLGDPGEGNGNGQKLRNDIKILQDKKEDLEAPQYGDLKKLAIWWQGGYVAKECSKLPVVSGNVEERPPAMCYADQDTGPVKAAQLHGGKMALSWTALVPACMALGYLILIIYFWTRGGYEAEVLLEHKANDEEFTGGVEGPADY